VRSHCIFNNLDSFAADFISAGFTPDYGMRSGLGSDQVLAVARVFTALFLRSDGSLPKFPFSGIGRGRNYEMKIRTAAETLLGMFYAPRCVQQRFAVN
jgi:hypothetical protein